jgi:diacylglycerol kinase (ATP)
MRIALLHNPKAGNGTFRVSKFVRQIEKAGHKVVYASIKQNDWQDVFAEPIDRVIIAGGDGSVSRAAPWLRARDLPFCILPLGTANNCARGLGQLQAVEYLVTHVHSAAIRRIDLGLVSSPAGQRFFIESAGVGLLPRFMSAMRAAQKKNGSKLRSLSRERLGKAKKYFGKWAREAPDFDCQLLLDDEPENGEFLLLEVANIGRIGPRLDLAPGAEPGDGYLDVVWVRREQRKEWLSYLKQLKKNGQTAAPVEHRRCRQITLSRSTASLHVDGKVFDEMATPCCITVSPGALQLIDFSRSRGRSRGKSSSRPH